MFRLIIGTGLTNEETDYGPVFKSLHDCLAFAQTLRACYGPHLRPWAVVNLKTNYVVPKRIEDIVLDN